MTGRHSLQGRPRRSGGVGEPAEGKPSGLVIIGAVGPGGWRVMRLEGERRPEAVRGDAVRTALRLCVEVARSAPPI